MSETYNLQVEAQRVIDVIHPQAGALMTLMCALHEAWQAGVEGRHVFWGFETHHPPTPEEDAITDGDIRRRIKAHAASHPPPIPEDR